MPSFVGFEKGDDNIFTVKLNDVVVGTAGSEEDAYEAYRNARRSLSATDDELILAKADLSIEGSNVLFGTVDSVSSMSKEMSAVLKNNIRSTLNRSYSIKINEFAVNLASTDDVMKLLSTALSNYDTEGLYDVNLVLDTDREVNVLTPQVVSKEEVKKEEEIAENSMPQAGFQAWLTQVVNEAKPLAYDKDFSDYDLGLMSMDFADKVEVVESYLPDSEITDLATAIDDVPKDFTVRDTGWPKNENKTYSGKCTILRGIAQSLNTIAVDVVTRLTPEKSYDFAHNRLNMSTLVDSRTVTRKNGETEIQTDIAISPMALGGLTDGVRVIDMAAAYSAFSNDGYYNNPVLYTKVYNSSGELILDNTPQKTEAMSAKTATYMVELLRYAVTNGTGAQAALGNGIAVGGKTGTTTSNYDRWFAGITPYYTGVVWFGYDRQQEVTGVSTNPALYLWKQVMQRVHAGLPERDFYTSVELVKCSYCLDSGLAPGNYCSRDPRGSRVATAYVAKEDVPTETCNCHRLVDVCAETGLPANQYCNQATVQHAVRVYVDDRKFPISVPVGDSGACIYPNSICTTHNAENDANLPPEPDPIEEPTPGFWENLFPDRPDNNDSWWDNLFPSNP